MFTYLLLFVIYLLICALDGALEVMSLPFGGKRNTHKGFWHYFFAPGRWIIWKGLSLLK